MAGKTNQQTSQKSQKVKYYIGGRQYIPDDSILLCVYETGRNPGMFDMITQTQKLYRTLKGSFFLVSEDAGKVIKVELLDPDKALSFMDAHATGIITGNYDMALGVPEMG